MADNKGDTGIKSKKDARREARIEAKRKKLAEQRANRLNAQRTGSPDSANDNVKSTGKTDAAAGEILNRPVTPDSANREMHVNLDKIRESSETADPDFEKAEQYARPEGSEEHSQTDLPEGPEEQRETDRSDAADENRKGAPSVPKTLSLASLKERFAFIRNIKISRATLIRCCIILLLLIGVLYGISVIKDYYNKKPEVIVSDEGYNHYYKFEKCVVLNGIDISEHIEGDINWDKVKSSGIDFVFIRSGYRAADDGSLHADSKFASNVEAAQKAGLMVGTYFYSQALNADEGREEAEFVLDIVKDFDMTMPLVIDYEIYKDGRLDQRIQAGEMYAASFYHDAVLGFTETVEAAGYESAVYASKDMLTNYMQADLIDDMATVWLAKYDSNPDLDADYWFWQCSENGRAGGIEGDVDQDFWYLEPGKAYPTRAKGIKNAVSVGDCKISFRKDSVKLRNFRAEPKFAMTYEGKGMTEGRDYVSSVVHNTQSGTGYVIIRGIGKYKDWIMHPFTIE